MMTREERRFLPSEVERPGLPLHSDVRLLVRPSSNVCSVMLGPLVHTPFASLLYSMNRSSTSLHDGALLSPSHVSSALSACAASGPDPPSLLRCSSHSRKDAACRLAPCACIMAVFCACGRGKFFFGVRAPLLRRHT